VQFVQVVLTDEQALLLKGAADIAIEHAEDNAISEDEQNDLRRLAVFLTGVATTPEAFPVTGRMAANIKKRVRDLKGPAQPTRNANQRKARQERRQSVQKRARLERRETVAEHNAARERYERDMAELAEAQAELEERLAGQPRFDVFNVHGELVVAGVPAEFVRNAETLEPLTTNESVVKAPGAEIILPGSYEKAQEREASEFLDWKYREERM